MPTKKVNLLDMMLLHTRAASGEWYTDADNFESENCLINAPDAYIAASGDWGGSILGADALFIVKAHNEMPAMVKELDAARKKIKKLEAKVKSLEEDINENYQGKR